MLALICVREDESDTWRVAHGLWEADKAPEEPGPEFLEECRAEGYPQIMKYKRLPTALLAQYGARNFDYLHIWRDGSWTSVKTD